MNPVICSLSQICDGSVIIESQQIELEIHKNSRIRIHTALIGGKTVSATQSQIILDENGFKFKIKNPETLKKGRFWPETGDYCTAVVKISKICKKMSSGTAIKIMKCNDPIYFQNCIQGTKEKLYDSSARQR